MRFIAGMDHWVANWVAERIPNVKDGHDFGACTAMGLLDNGELIAGCVYNNYRRGSYDIELSFAAESPKWATRNNIKTFLAYPFYQLGCRRVTAIIDERNDKAIDFVERIGMGREGEMRKAMDGIHTALIYGMLFDECKWFKKERESWVKNPVPLHQIRY